MRIALEQFYTRPEIAKLCYDELCRIVDVAGFDAALEPSAGSGAFLDLMPRGIRLGIDLDPKCPGVDAADFFHYSLDPTKRNIVVGNPPFGRNGSLAVRFFNRAATFADVIAFVLPKTFTGSQMADRLDRSFHALRTLYLPDRSFLLADGRGYSAPSVFKICERREMQRRRFAGVTRHADFMFTKRADASFGVVRVGSVMGSILEGTLMDSLSPANMLFVKAGGPDVLPRFRSIDFSLLRKQTRFFKHVSQALLVQMYDCAFSPHEG